MLGLSTGREQGKMHRSVCTFPSAVACEAWTGDGTWTDSGSAREQEKNGVIARSENNIHFLRDEGPTVVLVSTAGLGDDGKVEDEVGDKRRGSDEVTTREGIEDERRSIPGGYIVASESPSSASSGKDIVGGRWRRGKRVSRGAEMRILVIVVALLWAHLVVPV